jgi:hypothetical protein
MKQCPPTKVPEALAAASNGTFYFEIRFSNMPTLNRALETPSEPTGEDKMSIGTLLLIILIIALIGALPTWGYSSGWGYFPSGGIGLIVVILLILLLLGRI